ncbi:hypothetical protein Syun_002219 [Stephania yunnanensis]|uniref:Uncharacterized protein n=1 Tax=Stephania yunnanensis TaxID=152371 RepID=A0AAP0Q8K6_9MAGN
MLLLYMVVSLIAYFLSYMNIYTHPLHILLCQCRCVVKQIFKEFVVGFQVWE